MQALPNAKREVFKESTAHWPYVNERTQVGERGFAGLEPLNPFAYVQADRTRK